MGIITLALLYSQDYCKDPRRVSRKMLCKDKYSQGKYSESMHWDSCQLLKSSMTIAKLLLLSLLLPGCFLTPASTPWLSQHWPPCSCGLQGRPWKRKLDYPPATCKLMLVALLPLQSCGCLLLAGVPLKSPLWPSLGTEISTVHSTGC